MASIDQPNGTAQLFQPLDLRMEDQVTDDDGREPYYDRDRHQWVPRCPHRDVCTGCDARGYCTREESR